MVLVMLGRRRRSGGEAARMGRLLFLSSKQVMFCSAAAAVVPAENGSCRSATSGTMPPAERIPAAAVPSTARLRSAFAASLAVSPCSSATRRGARLVNLGDVRDRIGFTVEKEVAKAPAACSATCASAPNSTRVARSLRLLQRLVAGGCEEKPFHDDGCVC